MYGDCHIHVFLNGWNYQEAVRRHKTAIDEAYIHACLFNYKENGITFIRDGGDAFGVSETAAGLAADYGICYLTPIFAIHKSGYYGGIVGKAFGTMKEYHSLVREVKERGGNFIKMMASGILDFNQFGNVTGKPLQKEEIKEMIHITHEEGLAVMVHVNGAEAVRNSAVAGADSIEHGNYTDKDCLSAMKESGSVWVPTLAPVRNLIGSDRDKNGQIERIYQAACENTLLAYEMGVGLALGSDAGAYGVMHGQGIMDEYTAFMELLGYSSQLDERLKAGERKIREKFAKFYQ